MNLISQSTMYQTTEVIENTFALLSEYAAAVHLKDLQFSEETSLIRIEEVNIGDGTMDYSTYLKKLSGLDTDIPCYCEHYRSQEVFAMNLMRLHYLASKEGLAFVKRKVND